MVFLGVLKGVYESNVLLRVQVHRTLHRVPGQWLESSRWDTVWCRGFADRSLEPSNFLYCNWREPLEASLGLQRGPGGNCTSIVLTQPATWTEGDSSSMAGSKIKVWKHPLTLSSSLMMCPSSTIRCLWKSKKSGDDSKSSFLKAGSQNEGLFSNLVQRLP